jgi:transcriptional regulator
MSPTARVEREPIPPGTLDMLILKTIAVAHAGELHGFEIAEAIQRGSRDVLQVEEGSLYPALQRMLVKGWIVGDWRRTPENRRARYYSLTTAGKRHLEREIASYQRVAQAIALILQPA